MTKTWNKYNLKYHFHTISMMQSWIHKIFFFLKLSLKFRFKDLMLLFVLKIILY